MDNLAVLEDKEVNKFRLFRFIRQKITYSKLIQYHNTTSYAYILDLDSEQLDKTGIDLGATGRLALMAKLAQGTGMQLPQAANQALNSAVMQVWSVVRHLCYWGSNLFCIVFYLRNYSNYYISSF